MQGKLKGKWRFIIEQIIREERGTDGPPTVPFEEAPYRWLLFGLRDPSQDGFANAGISRDLVSASWLLQYARQHNVPKRYLIGFIEQSGTRREIIRKAKQNPPVFEPWYHEYQAERAERKNRASRTKR